jgi:phosphoglycerol transferase MdoB-like AlkP superfamily enzyme
MRWIKNKLPYPVQLLIFWLFVFFFYRLLFAFVYGGMLEGGFGHKLLAFIVAMRLDVSTFCYLSAVIILIWFVYLFKPMRGLFITHNVLHYILISLVTIIHLSNLGLYGSWGTVINKRLLLYLKNPVEISHFMDTWKLIALPIIIILFTWLSIVLYNRITNFKLPVQENKTRLIFIFSTLAFLVLGFRGGWQRMPINESASSYSDYETNNDLCTNPVYYFGHSVSGYFYLSEAYKFYSEQERDLHFKSLVDPENKEYLVQNDSVFRFEVTATGTIAKPNIVIILLESWTADIIAKSGGLKGVTPFTDSLIESSILFTRAYGSGYRTDQGLPCVLSGYPAQPDNSIIAYPDKSKSLPCLSDELRKLTYRNSFFYGGDIGFANMKSYLSQHSFDKIFDKNDFPAEQHNSKWGAHDGFVLDKQIEYLKTEKQPFFSAVLTLSTHEPFDVPVNTPFNESSEPEKFKKSAWYTDQCLRKYFKKAEKQSWYKNTVFILVADHGHTLPLKRDMNTKEAKKVTLIMTGNRISENMRGQKINYTVAQHDIAATVMEMIGKKFPSEFSYNFFKRKSNFAYFSNERVLGFVNDSSEYIYHFGNRSFTGNVKLEAMSKAYLQKVYDDFISR